MKLIYFWTKNCSPLLFDGPLCISPEFNIEFDREKSGQEMSEQKIIIRENSDYIQNFYGKNISELTAIVGENGTGKTTLSSRLVRACSVVNAVSEDAPETDEFIQIYKVDLEGNHKKYAILIYYYLTEGKLIPHYEIFSDIKFDESGSKCINIKTLKGKSFSEEYDKHDLTTIYYSNVFEPRDLTRYGFFSNSSQCRELYKSHCYSPALNIRVSRGYVRDLYGQAESTSLMVSQKINRYAELVSDKIIDDYIQYQSNLLIRSFFAITDEIREILPIYKTYKITVNSFANLLDKQRISDLAQGEDVFYKQLNATLKSFLRCNIHEQSFFLQCYLALLFEIDFYEGYKYDKENPLKKSEIGLLIEEYLSSQENFIDTELLGEIKKRIKALASNEGDELNEQFGESSEQQRLVEWHRQLESSVEVFQKYRKADILAREHTFGKEDDFILRFYLEEFEKPNSIFKRLLNFELIATSSGEYCIANLFACISNALSKPNTNSNNILLIFDELDASIHPTWQQKILKLLIGYIEKGFENKRFQIIFTTHSPIILSDMTRDRVIMLEKAEDSKNVVKVKKGKSNFLGANIERLFYDGFFMENGSIGAVSKEKITKVLDYTKSTIDSDEKEITYIINSIGEPSIQRVLREKLMDRTQNTHQRLSEKIEEIGIERALEILQKN